MFSALRDILRALYSPKRYQCSGIGHSTPRLAFFKHTLPQSLCLSGFKKSVKYPRHHVRYCEMQFRLSAYDMIDQLTSPVRKWFTLKRLMCEDVHDPPKEVPRLLSARVPSACSSCFEMSMTRGEKAHA